MEASDIIQLIKDRISDYSKELESMNAKFNKFSWTQKANRLPAVMKTVYGINIATDYVDVLKELLKEVEDETIKNRS